MLWHLYYASSQTISTIAVKSTDYESRPYVINKSTEIRANLRFSCLMNKSFSAIREFRCIEMMIFLIQTLLAMIQKHRWFLFSCVSVFIESVRVFTWLCYYSNLLDFSNYVSCSFNRERILKGSEVSQHDHKNQSSSNLTQSACVINISVQYFSDVNQFML